MSELRSNSTRGSDGGISSGGRIAVGGKEVEDAAESAKADDDRVDGAERESFVVESESPAESSSGSTSGYDVGKEGRQGNSEEDGKEGNGEGDGDVSVSGMVEISGESRGSSCVESGGIDETGSEISSTPESVAGES